MPTYVAFLRAINLGAKRTFPKAAIAEAVESLGCTGVETYINTGNVRLTTSLRSRARLETALEAAFLARSGFAVPTITFGTAELAAIDAEAASLAERLPGVAMQYVSLLKEPAPSEAAADLEALEVPGEHVWVRDRAVHIAMEQHDGYRNATITNALVEKKLGVATNRNLTVIRELSRRWC